jgi:hypothetical protein
MNKPELIEAVQKAYHGQPLGQLVDNSVIELLGLSSLEVRTLAALLVAGGTLYRAQELVYPEMKRAAFDATVESLAVRGLIERDPDTVTFEGAERQLRMQTPDELSEDDIPEAAPPPVKVVHRSLYEQVLLAARSANGTRGLARAYSLIFGGSFDKRTFGLLGKYVQLLGVEKAALFLLEHAAERYRDPLSELLPLAIARSKGWRPADAPRVEVQDLHAAQLAAATKEKWNRLGLI